MIVFDTYAWIEYFLDTEKANKVENYLENDEVFTPTMVLLELSAKAEKEEWNIRKYIDFIKSKSIIINLDEEIIIYSGKIYNQIRKKIKGFGLIDATILSSALIKKCDLLTGDLHFKGLKNVVFLSA